MTLRLHPPEVHPLPLGAGLDQFAVRLDASAGGRYEVRRAGARPEIPYYVRIAVYRRDADTCQLWCGEHLAGSRRRLGFIVPWSAGGAADSANLRLVCDPCSEIRSNFIDVRDDRRRLPVTWWCRGCWGPQTVKHPGWLDKLGPAGWRTDHPLVDPEGSGHGLLLAHCALCDSSDYTSTPL